MASLCLPRPGTALPLPMRHRAGGLRTPPHHSLPLQSLTETPGPRSPLPNSFLCAQNKMTNGPDTHHTGGQEQGEPRGMRPCPEKESACRVSWQRDRQDGGQLGTQGQTAVLVGRWPVGQQDCDGQSSGWHPQTVGIGAFSETESGLPWKREGRRG